MTQFFWQFSEAENWMPLTFFFSFWPLSHPTSSWVMDWAHLKGRLAPHTAQIVTVIQTLHSSQDGSEVLLNSFYQPDLCLLPSFLYLLNNSSAISDVEILLFKTRRGPLNKEVVTLHEKGRPKNETCIIQESRCHHQFKRALNQNAFLIGNLLKDVWTSNYSNLVHWTCTCKK